MQKILTFIIACGIIYMIVQKNIQSLDVKDVLPINNSKETITQPQEKKEDKQKGTFLEKTLSNILVNVLKTEEGRLFMENILQPANKSIGDSSSGFQMNDDSFIQSIFKIITFGEKTAAVASCGHLVKVEYKILNANNSVIEENTSTFPLGSGKIAPGLDAVIVGMSEGQTRHAIINSKYLPETANNKASYFKVNVLLKEITPKNFVPDDVKIFDDKLAYQMPLLCSNRVAYDAKITRLKDGKTMFNSKDSRKRIAMKIGNLNYPVIFSHALHNKIPVGTRTVIAKGNLFKSYVSDYSTIFQDKILPDNEYFMLELSNFDANKGLH